MSTRSPSRYSELKRVADELGSRVSQLTNDNNEIVPRTTLEMTDLLLVGRNLVMGILTETLSYALRLSPSKIWIIKRIREMGRRAIS